MITSTEIASYFGKKRKKKKSVFFCEITVEKPKGCC
jgi:hypothetical protein